jgi:toxin ParE1/3/4
LKVTFTPLAERQLDDLYEYVATRADPARADSYVDRIVAYCETLKTFPQRGHKRDDVMPGLRIIGFERRVTIAFLVTADAVLIEGILYGGRDIPAAFRAAD